MSSNTAEQLLHCVRELIGSRAAPTPSLEPTTPLFSSGLIDSMGWVELLAFIERDLGVNLTATFDQLTVWDTAAALAAEIDRRRAERSRSHVE